MTSTTTSPPTPAASSPLARLLDSTSAGTPAQPITMRTRLYLELRKALNTRSGLILTLAALAWAPLVLIASLVAVGTSGHDAETILGIGATGVAVLLPIVTLLHVTGEWGQRSILTTFSLDPARGRILVAKVLAGQVLALAVIASALAFSLITALLMGVDLGGTRDLGRVLLGLAAGGTLYALMGSALGAMTLSTPLGLGVLLVAPQLVLNLGPLAGERWAEVGPWVEISMRLGELTGGTVAHWGHLAVACALWIALPLVVGFWRVRRADVA
ncbi:hypothetical protein [Pseudactinotalea sp. Z1732]|uniref:hypothetical protein n=1 Tax=Micrococcales TaxID=85006 RepID=UPI003C797A4C